MGFDVSGWSYPRSPGTLSQEPCFVTWTTTGAPVQLYQSIGENWTDRDTTARIVMAYARSPELTLPAGRSSA